MPFPTMCVLVRFGASLCYEVSAPSTSFVRSLCRKVPDALSLLEFHNGMCAGCPALKRVEVNPCPVFAGSCSNGEICSRHSPQSSASTIIPFKLCSCPHHRGRSKLFMQCVARRLGCRIVQYLYGYSVVNGSTDIWAKGGEGHGRRPEIRSAGQVQGYRQLGSRRECVPLWVPTKHVRFDVQIVAGGVRKETASTGDFIGDHILLM